MDDSSPAGGIPNPEGPEVLYVQGVSDPTKVGQYPPTQAVAALILGILGFMGFSCCTAIPGVILAKSAMEVAEQHPGHPDTGMAKAANIVGWVCIVGTILTLFIILGLVVLPLVGVAILGA